MPVASTCPDGPTRRAAARVCPPAPAATSSTRPPSATPASSSICSVAAASHSSMVGPHRCQASAAASHCRRVVLMKVIGFDERTAYLRDSKGLRDLAALPPARAPESRRSSRPEPAPSTPAPSRLWTERRWPPTADASPISTTHSMAPNSRTTARAARRPAPRRRSCSPSCAGPPARTAHPTTSPEPPPNAPARRSPGASETRSATSGRPTPSWAGTSIGRCAPASSVPTCPTPDAGGRARRRRPSGEPP